MLENTLLTLTCEHCKNKTLLISSSYVAKFNYALKDIEIIWCSNGECSKASNVDLHELKDAYIISLEAKVNSFKSITATNKHLAVMTKSGSSRMVISDSFNSIQWAITENIKDLK